MSKSKPTFGRSASPAESIPAKQKRVEVAALWKKTTKEGEEMFSIKFKFGDKEFNCVAFKNNNKIPGDTKPDFVAYK